MTFFVDLSGLGDKGEGGSHETFIFARA